MRLSGLGDQDHGGGSGSVARGLRLDGLQLDRAVAAAIEQSFLNDRWLKAFSFSIDRLTTNRLIMRSQHSGDLDQLDAGEVAAIGCSTARLTALTALPAGAEVTAVELTISYIRPVQGATLGLIGEVLRAGKSLIAVEVRAFEPEISGTGETVALMQATLLRTTP